MNYALRRDVAEATIVEALRIIGCIVVRHHGRGEPDLFVCRNGDWYAIEVKGDKGKLNEEQVKFRARVRSQGSEVHTVRSAEEALRVVRGCSR